MSVVNDRPRELLITTEEDEDDQVRMSVKDAGDGFDPQAADRLFQSFYTTKNDGMGIGLSVSRSIIESHHGRLWAALNNGPGATFSLFIPRPSEECDGDRRRISDLHGLRCDICGAQLRALGAHPIPKSNGRRSGPGALLLGNGATVTHATERPLVSSC